MSVSYTHLHCKVHFEPMDANGEELFKFESTVVGGSIPKEYIPAVGEGIEEAAQSGICLLYTSNVKIQE